MFHRHHVTLFVLSVLGILGIIYLVQRGVNEMLAVFGPALRRNRVIDVEHRVIDTIVG